ncbi:hypothetical protein JTE90_008538 [Oedothorax gibbosus]|uniref:Thymidine kinase n=1 Tax=Oedothorax gibbosus TaxID=931172 RepID=A0AAV6VI67_9ARAC|nr:hypothetical protein JTE90_008538 [Oedothorax gibbosus]
MLDFSSKAPKIVCPSQSKGHIQVIFGPMFSGKTTELIRRVKKYQIANHKCMIVRYPHNSRNKERGVSENDVHDLNVVSMTTLSELKNETENCSVVAVDEAQFFPDVVIVAEELANDGKIVIIAALDGTYLRQGFSNILQLIPLAESVLKLNSVCMICFEDASYTKRIGSETEVEVIGGKDKYMAVCRSCHNSTSPLPQNSKHQSPCKVTTIQQATQIC